MLKFQVLKLVVEDPSKLECAYSKAVGCRGEAAGDSWQSNLVRELITLHHISCSFSLSYATSHKIEDIK